MYFKGTIIITDPCYVMRKPNEEAPNFFTWKGLEEVDICTKFTDYTPEQLAAYKEYERASKAFNDKWDDWDKCECGRNMEILGIKHYFTKSTIYGDWSCSTFKIDNDPIAVLDEIVEPINISILGRFCADAGLVSVFYLDEILKYNPDFSEWAKEHDWCVTIIPDFDGEVKYYVDKEKEAHIIGKGNINFLTTQTGF